MMAQADSEPRRPSQLLIDRAASGLQDSSLDGTADSGFLPFASARDDVARLLVEHVARLRETSTESVSCCYWGLEPGFRLVFRRELCLKREHGIDDHKGKRPLRLLAHEILVQKVASSEDAFKVLARLLEKGRAEAVSIANKADQGNHPSGTFVISVSELAARAKDSNRLDIELRRSNCRMEASWKARLELSLENLTKVDSLKDLSRHQNLGLRHPLASCAFFGGGGGSDVIQAAALAKLFMKSNEGFKVLAVISVRTLYSKSTSRGEKRSVWDLDDHANPRRDLVEKFDGDVKIEKHHHGNARFVEDSIVCDFDNIHLVIDDKSEKNDNRLRRYAGALPKGVDSMFIIDTGGDVLGGMDESATRKTPDQDCRTQLATADIAQQKGLNSIVAIAALGVDAPPDAQSKLEKCDAIYYEFDAEDKQYLSELYSKWQFNGSPANLRRHPERYGKTPFAMLASFKLRRGESGFHALPLPESVINDFDNPWSCITWITPEMSCVVLANQAKLLSVIAPNGGQ